MFSSLRFSNLTKLNNFNNLFTLTNLNRILYERVEIYYNSILDRERYFLDSPSYYSSSRSKIEK